MKPSIELVSMQNHNIGNDTSASFRNATSTGRRMLNAADARSVIRTRATIRTAFTLIELLVVIAIIAILAGMLMPALNQAREKGVGASCIGRLKSIGQADALYQNDFGYISPAREYLAGSRGLYWCGDTSSSGGGSGDSIDFTAEGYLTPYIKRATGSNDIGSELSSNAFICPSGVVQGMLTGQKVTAANGGGYGVNRNVHGTLFMASPSMKSAYPLLRPGQIPKPSQTIGYGDSATSSGSELKVNNLISGNKVHFRHGKRGNFAYADGHVTSLPGFYTHSCGSGFGTSNPDEANNIGCVNPDEADCNTENSLFWSR